MDIYAYLKRDHRKVSELMEKLVSSRSVRVREELFEEIRRELLLHAETEQKTFYAALKKNPEAGERIKHAKEEHEEIKDYLSRLARIDIQSEKWMEQFGEFKHSVTHHVEEEEGEIFAKAKKFLSPEDAVQLAADMDSLKQAMEAKQAA
ncbi:MAG: hemerythrin domain-containing protein [Alphaproteobacteria bacterium]|nr:hemerythrin domain-containing protein [Alphaproteobacteria bacterium]